MGHQHVRPAMTTTLLTHHEVDGVPKSVQMDDIGSANALSELAPSRPMQRSESFWILEEKWSEPVRSVVGEDFVDRPRQKSGVEIISDRCPSLVVSRTKFSTTTGGPPALGCIYGITCNIRITVVCPISVCATKRTSLEPVPLTAYSR